MFRSTAIALALAGSLQAGAMELSAAINAAQLADPSVASALASRDAASENIAIARSRLLPQLSLQATEQQLDQTTVSALGPSDFRGRSRNGSFNIRQALFRPRDWHGLSIGRLQAEYGEYKLAVAQADLWNRASQAWVDYLAARLTRDAYARAMDSAKSAAEQERQRFEKGDGTRDAAAEAAAQAAQVRGQLVDAQAELEARRSGFLLITRVEPTGFERYRLPPSKSLPLLSGTLDSVLDRIVLSYPDLLAAGINERVNALKLDQASADHLPTVDLIGSATEAKNESTNTLGSRYRNQQIGVQVVIPIYQGGGVRAAERQAAAFYAAASADKAALEQRVRLQAVSDWQTMEGLRERIAAAEELLASAREQRRAAELGMKAGLKTWSDASIADQSSARREVDLINMVTAYFKTQARLLSLLPTTDDQWDRWTRGVWQSVQR